MARKSSKENQPRTVVHPDWKLRKASDYLEYDIHTLAAGIDLYFNWKGTEIANAALDSLLLRARLLLDFFMRVSAENDDVIAVDYFHDKVRKRYIPQLSVEIKIEREKINKRLMHLTTEPMPLLRSDQSYDLTQIIPPLIAAFRYWLSIVPNRRLQKPAFESKQTYERHLNRIEKFIN